MGQRCTVEGAVQSVIFQNEENGYTVLTLIVDGQEEPVTVVGCIPCAAAGEGMTVTGVWVEHPTYGPQLTAESVERRMPQEARDVAAYLGSGILKGVGPATAQRLVDRFGADTLRVIEEEPERLQTLKGITAKRAMELSAALRALTGLRHVMEFLARYDLPVHLAMAVQRTYGDGAMQALRDDPYLLSREQYGVDFAVTDAIALSMGFSGDDPCRLDAAVLYELSHNLNNGHVFLPREKLVLAASQLISVEPDAVELALDKLIQRYAVVEKPIANVTGCYLPRLYQAETFVAQRLLSMVQTPVEQLSRVDKTIADIEREQGVSYAPLQRQAVALAADSGVLLLTGGPGTGKTTTLRGILALLEQRGEKVALAAPTGRAAKRMAEITGREASTIHRLLEVEPKTEVLTFKRGEKNPLPADAVIVDEMSMVDTLLMEHLLRGMRLGARLIMVGDSDQLPSVSAGNVLRDLIQSGLVPCIHLERVFRQAAESLIVTNAHAIVRGEMPDLGCRTGDFFFLEQPDAFAQQRLVVDLVSRRLPKSYGYDPLRDIQVITPAKQGPLGTRELNRLLQGKLNPPERGKGEATLMGRTLREGDKVMQIRNNYDIIWQQPDGTAGTGIFNGDMGIIEMLDPGSKTIQVRFEEKLATYSFENQDQLEHAYAVTVHKSQGSEFEAVVMPLERRHPKLHYRNLLYTAVTRARKLLIMTGQKETVYAMVQNNRRTLRYTNQKEMLQEMCDE